VANALAIAEAKAGEADPVFAAIEAHKAAMAAHTAALDDWDDDDSTEACYDEWDAMADVLTCGPTTREGAIALREHAAATWDGEVTILEWAFQAGEGDPTHQAACDLPGMIAETLRSLIGGSQL